jgi:hypothetical protein
VVCSKADQFTPSATPQTDTRTISVNTEGVLKLEGFPQQIAHLTLREGNVYIPGISFGEETGELTITGDLRTEDGQSGAGILTGASFLTGHIRLLTADGGLHQWTMQTNSHLWLTADVSESNAATFGSAVQARFCCSAVTPSTPTSSPKTAPSLPRRATFWFSGSLHFR